MRALLIRSNGVFPIGKGSRLATGADLRRIALSLEGVSEAPHFDRAAFRYAKIFVTLAAGGKSANFKYSPDQQEFKCMLDPAAFAPVPGGWGRMGYTTAILGKLDEQGLRDALMMAYGNAAPKSKAKQKPVAGKPAAAKAPDTPAKPAGKK